MIQGIRARAPHARIYVVGYPDILPESGGGCWPSLPLSNGDLPWLRAKNKELNSMLAAQAAANGAHYVDTYTPGIGHDACQDNGVRWVEGIVPRLLQAAPVHPNATGMAGVAAVVAAKIQATPNLATAPQSVVATPGNGQVALSWGAPADDGGGAISAYRVFRNGTLVDTTPDGATRAFTDMGLVNGTTYRYRIAAMNASGQGALTDPLAAVPVSPPGAPAAPTVTPADGSVSVTWAGPASNGGSPVTGYRLYRDGVALPTAFTAGQLTHLDEDVVNGTTYAYSVAALNAAGEGPRSAETPATPVADFVCCPPNGFADVPGSIDAAVDWATWFDVATAYPDDTFRPTRPLKRSQAAAFLWHLLDEPAATDRSFPDVPASAPYATAVDWAVDQGLLRAHRDGTLRPKDAVTRSQFVVMVWKALGAPTVGDHHGFTDTRAGAGYQAALDWADHHGLVDDPAAATRFHPTDRATRGVAVTWLYRLAWTPDAWSATAARPAAILF